MRLQNQGSLARRHLALPTAVLLGTCSLWVSGCSGSEAKPQLPQSAAPTVEVLETIAPDGSTVPGTKLAVGQRAVVQFEADRKHRSLLGVTVTEVARGKVKHLEQFDVDDETKRSSVYYTTLRVRNLGEGDVSGQRVTLYGAVSKTLVVPPLSFGSTFQRCDYQPLPARFDKNDKATLCMVMLAPQRGRISEIQWRPADGEEPISWRVR